MFKIRYLEENREFVLRQSGPRVCDHYPGLFLGKIVESVNHKMRNVIMTHTKEVFIKKRDR